jgi:large subunit ribosomal protein L9
MSLGGSFHRASCRTKGGVSIILRQALDQLGYVGQEVVVAPGFARNYLVPKSIAVYATEPNRVKYKVTLEGEAFRRAEVERSQRLLRARVADMVLLFQRATKEDGALYSPVKASDIASQLESTPLRTLGVKEANVRIPTPITHPGQYSIEVEAVRSMPGLWCPLKIRVVVAV